jgi:hypothetical protein
METMDDGMTVAEAYYGEPQKAVGRLSLRRVGRALRFGCWKPWMWARALHESYQHKEKTVHIEYSIPGKNKVHDRTVGRAGIDEGGTVGGGQSHYRYLPHQPVGNGVLVSSDPFSSFEEDPKEGSLVAVDEPHVKIVKVGVHIGVQVDGLDVRPVLRVTAAGRKGDLEAHEAGARLEGRIVARA